MFKNPIVRMFVRFAVILVLIASNFLLVLIFLGFYQRYWLLIPYFALVIGLVSLLTKFDGNQETRETGQNLVSFTCHHVVMVIFGVLHVVLLASRWLTTVNRGEQWIPEIMFILYLGICFGQYFLLRSGKLARIISISSIFFNLIAYLTLSTSALYYFVVSMGNS